MCRIHIGDEFLDSDFIDNGVHRTGGHVKVQIDIADKKKERCRCTVRTVEYDKEILTKTVILKNIVVY